MNAWMDFKQLREQLNFSDVLRHYGVELKVKGNQHHGFCPLPSHNKKRRSPSFSANLKRGIWQCFGCGGGGNVLDFSVLMEHGDPKNGEDVLRVASMLKERFLGERAPIGQERVVNKEEKDENVIINAPLDFELKGLDSKHPYLFGRRFTAETIERFGLGFCPRGMLKDRIAIPLHDQNGKLVGYAGRVIDDETVTEENPKYRFPGRRERKGVIHEFRKSLLVYNAHALSGRPVDDVVVVEGFASVWWLYQTGIINVVSTMGAACSEEQAELIVSLVLPSGHVWAFTDGDSAGTRCAGEILLRISPHRFIRWLRVGMGKQPTHFPPSELKQLLPF